MLEALKHLNLTFKSQQPLQMYGKGVPINPEERDVDPSELLTNVDLNKVSEVWRRGCDYVYIPLCSILLVCNGPSGRIFIQILHFTLL
ncbi:hypothetical protein EON65_38730 [archaeon]|nr:MAG: hypothetical protein EON65_38730 [archaeon]